MISFKINSREFRFLKTLNVEESDNNTLSSILLELNESWREFKFIRLINSEKSDLA